jgi:hypothetical protein
MYIYIYTYIFLHTYAYIYICRRHSNLNNRRQSHGGLGNPRRTTLTNIIPIESKDDKIQENIYDIYSNIYDKRKKYEDNETVSAPVTNRDANDGDDNLDTEKLGINTVEKKGERERRRYIVI